MTGIVAIYDPQGEPEQLAGLVPTMCGALEKTIASWRECVCLAERPVGGRLAGAGDIEWYSGPCFGIGRFRPMRIDPVPQPAWNREHTICLVFDGELYSQDADRNCANDEWPLNDAALALRMYETRGEEFVRALNGNFALALWDNRQHKLIVANDRYGLRPLYHARAGSAHLWASSPKAILAHPAYQSVLSRSVNLAAMADFFCLNIPQGNDTIYDGIDEAPPASLATWQNGHARHQQYWDLYFQDTETQKPTGEYVTELVYLLRQAARRQQGKGANAGSLKAGLLLSGGHDSRVILSVLDKKDLTAFTFGMPYCDDIRFARRAARTCGVRHIVLDIEADYLQKFAATGIARTQDLISCTLFHGISTYDRAAAQVNALITGSAGEDIFGHFSRDPQAAFWAEDFSVDRYYDCKKSMSDHDLKQLVTPEYYRSLRGLARARFHQDMNAYPSHVRTNQIDYWSVRHQQRRLYNRLASLFPENLGFRPLYYDNDLIDFVQTIPPSKRWGEGSVYRQVLLRTAPELAQLSFTTTHGLGLEASPEQIQQRITQRKRWKRWSHIAHRLSKGLVPSLKATRLFADYGFWFRHELRGWVESILLDPRTLDRGYWRATAIREMVQKHQQGRTMTRQIAAMISFELWHRLYMDADTTGGGKLVFEPRSDQTASPGTDKPGQANAHLAGERSKLSRDSDGC